MVHQHTDSPSAAEISAALAAGFAVEIRRGGSTRLIGQGEHVIELNALGDRLFDVLPCERGALPKDTPHPQVPDPEFPVLSGYVTDLEMR